MSFIFRKFKVLSILFASLIFFCGMSHASEKTKYSESEKTLSDKLDDLASEDLSLSEWKLIIRYLGLNFVSDLFDYYFAEPTYKELTKHEKFNSYYSVTLIELVGDVFMEDEDNGDIAETVHKVLELREEFPIFKSKYTYDSQSGLQLKKHDDSILTLCSSESDDLTKKDDCHYAYFTEDKKPVILSDKIYNTFQESKGLHHIFLYYSLIKDDAKKFIETTNYDDIFSRESIDPEEMIEYVLEKIAQSYQDVFTLKKNSLDQYYLDPIDLKNLLTFKALFLNSILPEKSKVKYVCYKDTDLDNCLLI